jgi:hypothetical protein
MTLVTMQNFRVQAPARGEQGNFSDIFQGLFKSGRGANRSGFAVIMTVHSQPAFCLGWVALVPDGLAGPSVRPGDAPVIQPRPGVMTGNIFHVEELQMAEPAADGGQEMETAIHVNHGIGQAPAGDNHPAIHPRADNKFPLGGQRGPDRFRFERAYRQPGCWSNGPAGMEREMVPVRTSLIFHRASPTLQQENPEKKYDCHSQCQKVCHEQHQGHRIRRTHALNLRRLFAGSNKKFPGLPSPPTPV